jgi:hypothetical protein
MTRSVNPNIPVAVSVSNGYGIDPLTLRQVPVFTTYDAEGQVQALDGDDLGQVNYLNIQGTIRAVYIYGNVSGVIRPDSISSAKLSFASNESGVIKIREWNVFKVLEAWPDWCKVAVVYVEPAA